VRWQVEGEAFDYITAEFDVHPAGEGGATLLAAQAGQDEVWRAYTGLMNYEFEVAELPQWRPSGYQTPSPWELQFISALGGLPVGTGHPLLQVGDLPAGVQDRRDLFLLRKPWVEASTMVDGEERTIALRRVLDRYTDLGKRAGFAGAFARLQSLVLMKSIGTAAEFDAALTRAMRDRDLLDLGLSYPEAMQAVGLLVEDEPSLPGPSGPVSSSSYGRILERR